LTAAALPEADGEALERRIRGESRKTRALREVILEELAAYDGPMSSRQVFYRVVSRAAIENSKRGCRAVLRLVLNMRRDGSIPYARIVDRTRAMHQLASWAGVAEVNAAAALGYRRNLWAYQPTNVMIACEKQALEGIFAGIVDEYGASLWTIRGFSSETFEYEWAEEIKGLAKDVDEFENAEEFRQIPEAAASIGEIAKAGRKTVIVYFGDHDPSGLAIEEATRRKLAGFGAEFEWRRGGLLPEDLDAFSLVRVPVKRGGAKKKGDPRAKGFLNKFGDNAAELDALGPAELERRIRAAIVEHIDQEVWERGRLVQERERESLNLVRDNWAAALAGARATP
jgi:hypothetical protein